MRDDDDDEKREQGQGCSDGGLQLLFVRPGQMSDEEVEMHRDCYNADKPVFHAERDLGAWHINSDLDGLEVDYWYPISHSPRARRRLAVWG